MDLGLEFLLLDLRLYYLDLRYVKIVVGYCPAELYL